MLDPRIADGLTEVRRWSFDDVCHAHELLDELDEAEARRQASQGQTWGRP